MEKSQKFNKTFFFSQNTGIRTRNKIKQQKITKA